jgi:hypothetical protein
MAPAHHSLRAARPDWDWARPGLRRSRQAEAHNLREAEGQEELRNHQHRAGLPPLRRSHQHRAGPRLRYHTLPPEAGRTLAVPHQDSVQVRPHRDSVQVHPHRDSVQVHLPAHHTRYRGRSHRMVQPARLARRREARLREACRDVLRSPRWEEPSCIENTWNCSRRWAHRRPDNRS